MPGKLDEEGQRSFTSQQFKQKSRFFELPLPVVVNFAIAPNWTVESLSPDQSQTKVTKNILHCLSHGTQMGWLIDPTERCGFVYLPDRPTTVYDEPTAPLPVPEFAKDFNLTVEGRVNWLVE